MKSAPWLFAICFMTLFFVLALGNFNFEPIIFGEGKVIQGRVHHVADKAALKGYKIKAMIFFHYQVDDVWYFGDTDILLGEEYPQMGDIIEVKCDDSKPWRYNYLKKVSQSNSIPVSSKFTHNGVFYDIWSVDSIARVLLYDQDTRSNSLEFGIISENETQVVFNSLLQFTGDKYRPDYVPERGTTGDLRVISIK